MLGQGSPKIRYKLALWQVVSGLRIQLWLATTLLFVSLAAFSDTPVWGQDESSTISIRAIWGGPEAKKWKGKITLSDGEFGQLTTLGVEQFSSSSAIRTPREIRVVGKHDSEFNGVDISIRAPMDAYLYIELQTDGQGNRFRKSVSLRELIAEPIRTRIDSQQNYVSFFRTPGDEIQVELENDSTVFETGQRFAPKVRTNIPELHPDSLYRFQYEIRKVSNGTKVWSQSADVNTDSNGKFEAIQNPAMKLSVDEGVYEFHVELTERKIRNFSRQTFNRRFDFVVLSPKPKRNTSIKQAPDLWKVIDEKDVTLDSRDFDPLNPASILNHFQKQEWNNGKTSVNGEFKSGAWLELDVGGWQGYQLEIERSNRPHILEIEYPGNLASELGISILQPNPQGQFDSLGPDSGISTRSDPMVDSMDGHRKTHRIVFWPRKEKLYVILANRSSKKKCLFGKVRVYAGPESLVPLGKVTKRDSQRSLREFLAFYEQPFFPDQFQAPKRYDESIQQSLTDWQFFYVGANRLIESLRANGYTGAMITVMADGSSIYPSQKLKPGPKFDNGCFSIQRPDLQRKDVVKMLLRMFEREGLTLVPVFEFSAPLPAIERKLNEKTADASTTLLNINLKPPNWSGLPLEKPTYNLLSPLVQDEIENVINEFQDRYSDQPSLGGVAIKLGPETFTILPGQRWGFDQVTLNRFLREKKIDAQAIDRNSAIARITSGDLNQPWREWRIEQVTRFYSRIAKDIQSTSGKQQLYLAAVEIFRDEESHSTLAPNLRWANDYLMALRNLGLDPGKLDAIENLVFLRPNRVAEGEPLPHGRVEHELQFSAQKLQVDSKLVRAGDVFASRDHWVHYSQLQKQAPFQSHRGSLIRFQPLIPGGYQNRERFAQALASADSKLMSSGGLLVASGQDASLSEWIQVYTALPRSHFQTVATKNPEPVVVRQEIIEGELFFYVVNNSPWSVHVELTMNESSKDEVEPLGESSVRQQDNESTSTLHLLLEPYGLQGGKLKSSNSKIESFKTRVDDSIAKRIQDRISILRKKIGMLDGIQPMDVLQNDRFENISKSRQPEGWFFDSNRMFDIQSVEENPLDGKRCLSLSSKQGVVWLRSKRFTPPETGRLSVSVWLRVEDAENQPPLRLAIQGKHFGREYYRFANVGSLVPDARYNQIESRWKRFAVHFDDLPPAGLSDLQIGLDLMGPGQVWADRIEVYDRWFDENDQKSLTQTLALAGYQLVNKGDLNGSRRLLSSYWPQFIDEFIDEEPAKESVAREPEASGDSKAEERNASLFDRVRFRFPNRIFKIR